MKEQTMQEFLSSHMAKLGSKGGIARRKALSPARRRAIAIKAVRAREAKRNGKPA